MYRGEKFNAVTHLDEDFREDSRSIEDSLDSLNDA
jgi:hypothetical protein